jgi:hemerythrin
VIKPEKNKYSPFYLLSAFLILDMPPVGLNVSRICRADPRAAQYPVPGAGKLLKVREIMDRMNFIDWEDRYRTGFSLIDTQHKKLFVMANDIYRAHVLGKREAPALKYFPRRELEFLEHHLLMEEQVMLLTAYPLLEEHKKEHAEYGKIILNALEAADPEQDFFVRDWIFSHINQDMALGEYLQDLKRRGNMGTLSLAAVFYISLNSTKRYNAERSL